VSFSDANWYCKRKPRVQGAASNSGRAIQGMYMYVFVCLPTGSGKSLCYCLLPAAFDHLKGQSKESIVVVSPLIAMKDQVRSMCERDVTAVTLTLRRKGKSVRAVSNSSWVLKLCWAVIGGKTCMLVSPTCTCTYSNITVSTWITHVWHINWIRYVCENLSEVTIRIFIPPPPFPCVQPIAHAENTYGSQY
jgi:hypothetical protein